MSGAGKAGIAAAIAAAALGGYLLYGKNGAQNRRKVKGWMLKAKGEILERVENLESVSEDTYRGIVEQVVSRYKGAKNVTASELMQLAADAQKHWKALKPLLAKPSRNSSASRKSGAAKGGSRSASKGGGSKK